MKRVHDRRWQWWAENHKQKSAKKSRKIKGHEGGGTVSVISRRCWMCVTSMVELWLCVLNQYLHGQRRRRGEGLDVVVAPGCGDWCSCRSLLSLTPPFAVESERRNLQPSQLQHPSSVRLVVYWLPPKDAQPARRPVGESTGCARLCVDAAGQLCCTG